MRLVSRIALGGLLAVPPVQASLLEDAVAAHGGDALLSLSALQAEWRQSHALIHEDREPGPPWDHGRAWTGTVFDFTGGRVAERRLSAGSGYHSDAAVQAGEGYLRTANLLAGTQRFDREHTAEHAGAQARQRLPGLIVRLAVLEPGRWQALESGRCDDQPTDRARFHDPGGDAWILHLDPRTHLTRCLEYRFRTYDGELVPVTVQYRDWREVDGLPLPFDLTARGSIVDSREHLLHVTVNGAVGDFFRPFELPVEAAPPDTGFQVTSPADGVWVIGEGVFRQLFVELDDFVVAYDGLGGDVNRRLAALAERTDGKPVRYVILSHPHADHYPGLPELTAAGAKVVAVPAHWPAVRRLAGLGDEQWIPLRTDWVLERDGQRIVAADIGPTPHAEHLVALWLPAQRLLAQSDLFVRRHGAVRAATDNVRALAAVLERRGWQPRFVQDGHSPYLASARDLSEALVKEAVRLPPVWRTLPDLDASPRGRVEAALAAIGGADAVARAGGIAFSLDGTVDLGTLGQGIKPDASEPAPARERLAIDPVGDRVAHEWQGAVNADAVDHYRKVFTGDDRQDFIHLGDAFAFSTKSDFAEARARHERILPHALLAAVREAELEWLGWHEVAATLADGTRLRLRLDEADGPLHGFSYRLDMPVMGDSWVRWHYRLWRNIEGFGRLPGEVEIFLNDAPLRRSRLSDVRLGPAASEALLGWPADVPRPEVQPAPPEPQGLTPPELVEIAPGTFLAANVRGGFHPLVVELDDRLVVVDAPAGWWELYQVPAGNVAAEADSGAAAENLLIALHERFPGKPVGELVLTHHHNDHAGGLRPFVAAGARVVTHADNVPVVKAAARAPHTLTDDRAAGLELTPDVAPVRGTHVISEAGRSVVLMDVGENPHATGMLVVWLPDSAILYQADLFEPAPPFIFPSRARLTTMEWFVRWLERSGLEPRRVYAIHGQGRVTGEMLRTLGYTRCSGFSKSNRQPASRALRSLP